MADHQKTTVYLNASDYRRLKGIAYERDIAPASLIREAVADYVTRHAARAKAAWIGSGDSGLGDVSSHDEEYLAGMGQLRPATPNPPSDSRAKRR